MNKVLAPIVLFVYARPEHTRKTIEALRKNEYAKESELFIFADNAKNEKAKKNVKKVRQYINSINRFGWFKCVYITESKENKGLANSVIQGVSEIIEKYGRVIVVEDDLVTSRFFLKFMNEALDFYEKDKKIWSISGYNPPIKIPKEYNEDIYIGYRGCSWGWATWKDRWNTIDWNVSDYKDFMHDYKKRKMLNRGGPDMDMMLKDQINGVIDSWAIRWCYEQSKQDKYTIYPVESLVLNLGFDGTGTHSGVNKRFNVKLNDFCPILNVIDEVNPVITKNFYNQFNSGFKTKVKKIIYQLHLEHIFYLIKKKINGGI